jgi:hypothetical protein
VTAVNNHDGSFSPSIDGEGSKPENSESDAHGNRYNGNLRDVTEAPQTFLASQSHLQPHNASPRLQASGISSHIDSHDSLIDRIEGSQEDLRDARDDLVGSRFRLRTKRQELNIVREKTVTRIGAAFDSMRRYFLLKGLDIPDDLQSVLVEVDSLRDALGEKEIDYEQAEKDYDLEEWQYTETEKQFIESLSRSTPLSVNAIPPNNVTADLTRHSFGDPDVLATPNLLNEPNLWPHLVDDSISEDILLEEKHKEDTVGQCKRAASTKDASVMSYKWSKLTENFSNLQAHTPSSTQQLAQPDESFGNKDHVSVHNKWLRAREYLDAWMLEVLKASSLQRKWLELLVPKGSASEEEWLKLVTQHWSSESGEDMMFHTGDTVISDTTVSRAVSSHARHDLFGSSRLSDSGTGLSSDDLFLPDGRVADTVAPTENPAKIKVRDLLDSPRQVTFQTSSSSRESVSTQPTVMGENLPASRLQLHYESDDASAQIQPEEHISLYHGPSVYSASTQPTTTFGTSRPSVTNSSSIFNHGGDSHSDYSRSNERCYDQGTTDFGGISEVRVIPAAGELRGLSDRTPSSVQSSAVDGKEIHGSDALYTAQHTLSPQVSQPSASPISTEASPSESSMSKDGLSAEDEDMYLPTMESPFILVKNQNSPWALPLLRLTPLSTPLFHDRKFWTRHNPLRFYPFVSVPDTPFRLPGPSSYAAG